MVVEGMSGHKRGCKTWSGKAGRVRVGLQLLVWGQLCGEVKEASKSRNGVATAFEEEGVLVMMDDGAYCFAFSHYFAPSPAHRIYINICAISSL